MEKSILGPTRSASRRLDKFYKMNKNKFRIWDKKYKVWADPHCWRLNARGEVTWNRILSSPNGQEDFVIQQFIGMQDVKDKDIYEGDIVKDDCGYITTIQWGEIEYCGHFGFQQYNLDGKPSDFYGAIQSMFMEVVGNVFENPELMIK